MSKFINKRSNTIKFSLYKERRNQTALKYSIKHGCVTELFTLYLFSLQNVKSRQRATLYHLQNPSPILHYYRDIAHGNILKTTCLKYNHA